MAVHSTSIVEDGARLGAGVEIGPFCHVGARVTLGEGVALVSHVSIGGVTSIGARCRIHPQAALGGEAQIRVNDFSEGRLEIGEDCVLREGVSMSCGSKRGHGLTRVGARGYFMANSHVGHDCSVGDDVTFANSVCLGGHVAIGDRVVFGGVSAVQQFCRVGRGAMVGGLTGVNRDIIPYAMAFGDHVELAGLNLIGLKRSGKSRQTINALRGAFRLVFYGQEGSLAGRADQALAHWPDVPEVREMVEFILAEAKQELCLARGGGAAAVIKLGIIAGGGDLPRAVAMSARTAGRDVFVIALVGSLGAGSEGDWVAEFPHEWASLGAPGQAFKSFRREGVEEVLLAGKVDRPNFSGLKLDMKGVMLLPRALKAARAGDDALLRFLVTMFEEEGFRAVGVAEAAPGLVCGEGALGRLTPDQDNLADMQRGFAIVAALGALDVGQAAVVCDGLALAVEAAEGTDLMIERIASLREALRGTASRRRGVLVKALKPTQDAKTDMPVIGVATVEKAAAAGLAGIALQAGGALIVGKEAVAARADALGLFVTGVRL